jgi:hypothetical protein
MNHLGIDIRKRKYIERHLKMIKERYWSNSSLVTKEMENAICLPDTATWKMFY